jgi:hypothetical protein
VVARHLLVLRTAKHLYIILVANPLLTLSCDSPTALVLAIESKLSFHLPTTANQAMTVSGGVPSGAMTTKKLMSFAEFEAFVGQNEWISNDVFDHDSHPNHIWFQVDTSAVAEALDKASTKIAAALGTVAKDDVELRHLERKALELRHVLHEPPKRIFCMGSAGMIRGTNFTWIST